MSPTVAILLVSHDGASWLPTVIDGIRAQQVQPRRVVAVDTGSKDGSTDVLRQAFRTVIDADRTTTFPQAAAVGLAEIERTGEDWVWILHDDSTPDPAALAELLRAAEAHPEADVLGPKLREWPSLRRLLEIGVTISGTGRRETGLERGEYDQGQHDDLREVLAVNTAGMLVRREVLAGLGGFDDQLPMFGNDLDFGWRAAGAGHRTLAVPQAVVFHVEAAHRGVRRTPLTGRHPHYQERRAALYTLLANSPGRSVPWKLIRLAFGTLLRMLGFLGVRDLGSALDELAALVNVYTHPGQIRRARKARRDLLRTEHADRVRGLLPSWWVPYRHGLDFVGDVASALTNQAADVAERRRLAKAEADPSSFAARRQVAIDEADEDELMVEDGWLVRFVTNPIAVLLTLVALLGVVGARSAFGEIAGGGLSPVPGGAGDWWRLHLESWHLIGQGSDVPAPPYVFPLAILATLLLGHTGWAVTVVLVVSFPIALWGAWRLLRVVGRLVSHRGAPRWLVLWGATTYAMIPAISGAWGDGRLGPVVVSAVLPWLVHAALHFADPEADRRRRAGWRAGLLLTLAAAFSPSAWLVAVVLAIVVLVAGFPLLRGVLNDRSIVGPPLTALAVPVVLLLPWWLPALLHGAGGALLLDPGRLPAPVMNGADLVLGRLPELGAPWWLGLVLPVLAVLALLPGRTRIPVMVTWLGGLAAALTGLLLSLNTLDLPVGSIAAGAGAVAVVLQGAAVLAVVLGAQGAVLGGLDSWRRPVAAALAAVAVAGTLGGLGWFVVAGGGSVGDGVDDDVPAYMLASRTGAEADDREAAENGGVLVVRGSVEDGLRYSVLRGDGLTLGEDEIASTTPADSDFSALVRDLAVAPDQELVQQLADAGIAYVVMPAPADPAVSQGVDASGGLTQASTADPTDRAWHLDPESVQTGDADLGGSTSWLRIVLLVVHLIGAVAVVVLCLPTLERRRR